ncbi:hypothetical protein SKAU_G00424970 [Synaphobranchus kaupii]|uniref:Uncharacterized protein n=1 Tax=Synaphobranchus kaupii TaxID=118154 RepID=A0A9Q1E5N6_SYNKA|nr:hypothetical protein SKAU_G00424970 [Synaphobranchus kaupii]
MTCGSGKSKKTFWQITIFQAIASISLTAIGRILRKHQVTMKLIYLVPFQRNEDRVKALRVEYVQRMMEIDAGAEQHEILYVNEAGFNLCKIQSFNLWNIIGQRAPVAVPGQRGADITMCCHFQEWS